MRVSMEEINTALAVMFASDYIGDFMHNGSVRRVTVQADGKNRVDVEDVAPARAQCAGPDGAHVGLRHAGLGYGTAAAEPLQRLPAFKINGSAAPGHSSGEAMRAMEQLASELPRGIGFAWSSQSYEEKLSGNQANVLFALSILVFLALAALYESWAIPLAVILVVPLGVIGALWA